MSVLLIPCRQCQCLVCSLEGSSSTATRLLLSWCRTLSGSNNYWYKWLPLLWCLYFDFHNSAESHLQALTANQMNVFWLPSIKLLTSSQELTWNRGCQNQLTHDITYQSASLVPTITVCTLNSTPIYGICTNFFTEEPLRKIYYNLWCSSCELHVCLEIWLIEAKMQFGA